MATTKKYVSLEKLGLYDEKIKKVITDGDAAALQSAKDYADGLAVNYEKSGAAATAEANAKAYADGKDTAIAAAQKAGDDAMAAAGVADGKAVAAQTDVDNLEAYVGTFTPSEGVDTVVKYIDAKTEGIATDAALGELQTTVTQLGKDIDAVEADYLKAADKTELEDAIALKADQTALDEVSGVANAAVAKTVYEAKVAELVAEDSRIVGLVEAEAERAAGVEEGLEERLVEVETFFKTAEGETLDTALDTLVEIQKYLDGEGEVADQMLLDIAANKKAIEDHAATDHDFAGADAALKSELEGKINGKADSSVVTELSGKVTTAEGKITANEQAIAALQTAIGDNGSVDTMIDNAVSAAIEAEVERVDGLLDKKVDKVEGKGLSTNDLTNELKGQYDAAYAHSQEAHAPADAQKNVIETVKVNGVALTVTDKAVDVAVPVNVSELTNDKGYLVASDIDNKADKATTLAGYGITDAYTTAQTDTAIANAIGQFVEVSEEEINALFA